DVRPILAGGPALRHVASFHHTVGCGLASCAAQGGRAVMGSLLFALDRGVIHALIVLTPGRVFWDLHIYNGGPDPWREGTVFHRIRPFSHCISAMAGGAPVQATRGFERHVSRCDTCALRISAHEMVTGFQPFVSAGPTPIRRALHVCGAAGGGPGGVRI